MCPVLPSVSCDLCWHVCVYAVAWYESKHEQRLSSMEAGKIVWGLSYLNPMWSHGGPVDLYFSMLLYVTFFGRVWSVHSMLEFNAMKKNLRIQSDMERFFGLSGPE